MKRGRGSGDPVDAWAEIVDDPERSRRYKRERGKGGFVRSSWDEVTELIAAAHVHTIKRYGPDRVVGFSPIPAMSMASYAAGTRLRAAGFTDVRTELVQRPAPYEDLREWLQTNALSAHLLRLPDDLRERYLDEVEARLGPDSEVTYIRLDIDATRAG